MGRRRRFARPERPAPQAVPLGLPPLGILEEFSSASLARWRKAGRNLDRFSRALFFDLEEHRTRHSEELVDGIRMSACGPLEFSPWVRLVDYRYTNEPLSTRGSIKGDGGRFNIGASLNPATYTPFPALYAAEDFSTAYRERFGIDRDSIVGGLSAEELTLRNESSFSSVCLAIRVESCIDVGDLDSLSATADVLRKFKLPKSIASLAKSLRLTPPGLVRSAAGLQRQLLNPTWRTEPVQYGLPSNSQIFGRLCANAGVHAILYPSARDSEKRCLALFPQNWEGSTSFVEIVGDVPPEIARRRIDGQSLP